MKEHGECRSWQCHLTIQMSDWDIRTTTFLGLTCLWVSFLAKKKKKIEIVKKKNCLYSLRNFGNFRDAFIPRASNEELSNIHLAFKREWQRREVSVSIHFESQVISGVRPSVTASQLAQLSAASMAFFT